MPLEWESVSVGAHQYGPYQLEAVLSWRRGAMSLTRRRFLSHPPNYDLRFIKAVIGYVKQYSRPS
jgi:hypothetical protein